MLNTSSVRLFWWWKLYFEESFGSKTVILPIFYHVVTFGLQISEMLNIGPISIFNWQKFWCLVYLNRAVAPKLYFFSLFDYVLTLTFEIWTSNFQKCLKTVSKGPFHWQMLIPGTFEWSFGSKTAFSPHLIMCWPKPLTFGPLIFWNALNCPISGLTGKSSCLVHKSYSSQTEYFPIFGHLLTLTFDPQFLEMLNTAPTSFFHWKKMSPGTFECSYGSKTNFAHIWLCGELGHWPLDVKFAEKVNTASISLCDWQKILSGIFKWSCCSKTAFSTIFGHVVTLSFKNCTSVFQKCLTLSHLVFLKVANVWEKLLPGTFEWRYSSKTAFPHIWSNGDLWNSKI